MKRKNRQQEVTNETARTALKKACLGACQKILERIAEAREMIFNESRGVLRIPERLLRLTLNEAEAVARQTAYPDLFFPDLAAEKVQAVIAWNAKLQTVRRVQYAFWNADQAKNRNRHPARARA